MAKLIVTGAENVFGVIQSPLFWWAKIFITRFPFGSLKFSQLPSLKTRTGKSLATRVSSDDW